MTRHHLRFAATCLGISAALALLWLTVAMQFVSFVTLDRLSGLPLTVLATVALGWVAWLAVVARATQALSGVLDRALIRLQIARADATRRRLVALFGTPAPGRVRRAVVVRGEP